MHCIEVGSSKVEIVPVEACRFLLNLNREVNGLVVTYFVSYFHIRHNLFFCRHYQV